MEKIKPLIANIYPTNLSSGSSALARRGATEVHWGNRNRTVSDLSEWIVQWLCFTSCIIAFLPQCISFLSSMFYMVTRVRGSVVCTSSGHTSLREQMLLRHIRSKLLTDCLREHNDNDPAATWEFSAEERFWHICRNGIFLSSSDCGGSSSEARCHLTKTVYSRRPPFPPTAWKQRQVWNQSLRTQPGN